MHPRIDKLLRQRDLLREHLDWIEEEIAAVAPEEAAETRRSETNPLGSASTSATGAGGPDPSPNFDDSTANTLLSEPDIGGVQNEVRTGCMLYFGIASATLGLLITYIYWRY